MAKQEMKEVSKAIGKYFKVSPQKARLVVDRSFRYASCVGNLFGSGQYCGGQQPGVFGLPCYDQVGILQW